MQVRFNFTVKTGGHTIASFSDVKTARTDALTDVETVVQIATLLLEELTGLRWHISITEEA